MKAESPNNTILNNIQQGGLKTSIYLYQDTFN